MDAAGPDSSPRRVFLDLDFLEDDDLEEEEDLELEEDDIIVSL
eukprot:CAMPEP_0181138742 /NCGR_PEP_ID=MMETSP1071-20121207/34406_1 /TAXON_ID=35127 /ORGANISM="Thalassiosira sp., Strain NH16" /LENGTH=42 /DNA_ID= /DNA_START= /DNA_END= /DNA_ORIENTATION=